MADNIAGKTPRMKGGEFQSPATFSPVAKVSTATPQVPEATAVNPAQSHGDGSSEFIHEKGSTTK